MRDFLLQKVKICKGKIIDKSISILGIAYSLKKVYYVFKVKEVIKMEKPILVYKKRTEKNTNKIIIPKAFVQQWGDRLSMEIYNGYIKLVPIKEEK